jgi:iron-sulfur cluster assembly accessory protein
MSLVRGNHQGDLRGEFDTLGVATATGAAKRRCYYQPVEIAERPTTVVSLTERAATKIKELMAEEPEGTVGVLRVAIQGGGCNGFEYALGFDSGAQEGDHELLAHGVPVVVDPYSAPYLSGTEIDFVDGLQGGFAINNPNVVSSCGCGHSFQVADEAAGEAPTTHAGGGCGSGCG